MLGRAARSLEVGARQQLAAARRQWRLAGEDLGLQCRRKSAERLAELAAKQLNDGFREGDLDFRIQHRLGGQCARDHGERHVADDLRGRRDLDDVAEHLVDLGVRLRHFLPAVFIDPQRAGLLTQVGVLPARHAMQVHLGSARADVTLE